MSIYMYMHIYIYIYVGNYEKIGKIRETELIKSCVTLGINSSNITIINSQYIYIWIYMDIYIYICIYI